MLKKLQRQIVLILAIAAILLVATVVICVYTVNSYQVTKSQRNMLINVSMIPAADVDGKNTRGYSRIYRTTSFFTVQVLPDGTLSDVFAHNYDIDDSEAIAAARAAIDKQMIHGRLENPPLRFLKRTDRDGCQYISFINTEESNLQLRNTLYKSLALGALAGMLMFFLICLPLSFMLVKPVKRAWDGQAQFIADASHELKAPLTVILANMSILKKHASKPLSENREWIESAEEEALRMKALLEDMLDLARSENLHRNASMEIINLSDIATNVSLNLESIAFEAGVDFQTDIQEGIMVMGIRNSLLQMVVILLDNAIKYAGTGGRAQLSLSRVGSRVCLEISNTGVPIPREALPHIFERFYQGDPSHTDKRGFGLGLSIARNIIHAHAGSIHVRSDEHITVFSVYLNQSSGKKSRLPSK